jgi:hypothetical protein
MGRTNRYRNLIVTECSVFLGLGVAPYCARHTEMIATLHLPDSVSRHPTRPRSLAVAKHAGCWSLRDEASAALALGATKLFGVERVDHNGGGPGSLSNTAMLGPEPK